MSSEMWKRGMGMVVVAGWLMGAVGCAVVVGLDEDYQEKDGGGGNVGMGGGSTSSGGGMGGAGGGSGPECGMDGDCGVDVPACETAVCSQGKCVRTYEPDGKPLPNQVVGDCASEVCDGAGKIKLVAAALDVENDGKVCTEDACDGLVPVHTNVMSVACYTGPMGTMGVGICKAGVQQCDGQGEPVGGCQGEVVPGVESCILGTDEDCDGMSNEEGVGCVCVPGTIADCYSGPPITEGKGICHKGQKVCNADGLGYGGCIGEQTPQVEDCDIMNVDEDCDGMSNEEGAQCVCGDGFTSVGEECDDGNQDSTDMCTVGCKKAVCGDGIVQAGLGEECDDGNLDSTDACTTSCLLPACGDGVVQPGLGEQCDDGNLDSTDLCTVTCMNAACGDGFVQPGLGEQCDDGNLDSNDPCNSNCKQSGCGDGFVQPGLGEQCDDGNLDSNDPCNANCKPSGCGDGFVQPTLGEQCDDANLDSTDLCTATCMNATCGDGFVQMGLGEQCDDGNLDSSDPCNANCKPSGCGDGFVQMGLGEQCDDGGTADGDNCSPTCALQEVLKVELGYWCSCSILSGGKVKCWGYNNSGQLGLGDTMNRGDQPNETGGNLPPVDLGIGMIPTSIAGGGSHTCALLNSGAVKCWGYNASGQLGLGDTASRGGQPSQMGDSLPPVDLGAAITATAITAGGLHTCALLNNGDVKCWGYNNHLQLGLYTANSIGGQPGQMGDSLPPVDLGTGMTATAIAAGLYHTCVLLGNGSVKCWGHNIYGQLGLGDMNQRGGYGSMGNNLPPVDLGSGMTATAIAAGSFHTCALLNNGTVKCWGYNLSGQLGLGDTSSRGNQPNQMGDYLPVVDLGAGITATAITAGGYHTCARLNNGTVKCWGTNNYGQLGLGNTANWGDQPGEMGDNLPPVNLGTDITVTAIAAGDPHTCAILSTGALKCWGYNNYGQLGLGDTAKRGDQPNEMGDNLPTVKLFSNLW